MYISGVCSVLNIVLNLGLFTNNSVAKPGYFVWSRRQTFQILTFFSPYFCNKSFEADDEKMLSGESHGQGFQKPEAILEKDPAPQHCIWWIIRAKQLCKLINVKVPFAVEYHPFLSNKHRWKDPDISVQPLPTFLSGSKNSRIFISKALGKKNNVLIRTSGVDTNTICLDPDPVISPIWVRIWIRAISYCCVENFDKKLILWRFFLTTVDQNSVMWRKL